MNDAPLVSSWYQAELLAAEHMKTLGFADAVTTRAGSDGGIDVEASGAVAQVKHYSNSPVGSPEVQRLQGAALQTRQRLFYALTGYTSAAVDYASRAEIALFTYDLQGTVSPANDLATRLIATGHVPVDRRVTTAAREEFVKHIRSYSQQVVDVLAVGVATINTILEKDIERHASGLAMLYVTPDLLEAMAAEVGLAQTRAHVLADGTPRTTGEMSERIIELEAILQRLFQRFTLDYDVVARASETMRETGVLGSAPGVTREALVSAGLVTSD